MLRRKIETEIEAYLKSGSNKMLVVDGARQTGKSYIIRHIGRKLFQNYIEINMEADKQNDRLFENATSVDKFVFALSSIAGDNMKGREDTLVFIDEIQVYDHLLTLAKFLMEDGRFTYIASGSLLGVTFKNTQSVPVGSLNILHMYPLDFEEFMWANGVGTLAMDNMREQFMNMRALPAEQHAMVMNLFRIYLLVGGLPDAINTYISEHNIAKVRGVQRDIHTLYVQDAVKYEREASRKLKIKRIYDMVPSNLENRKKRVVVKNIEGKVGKRTSSYQDEFDYLVSAGITLEADAISRPSYPLVRNAGKNLLKLYMNDTGIFTGILYNNNIKPVLEDRTGINLGAVYENVVAQELKAHGFKLYYYDNKSNGEVDYLIDDTLNLTTIPLEVKSGKDYTVHSALDKFLKIRDYRIKRAFVLSNEREVFVKEGITYIPVYYIMFFNYDADVDNADLFF